jgi:uncharacterized membrane protein YfcA
MIDGLLLVVGGIVAGVFGSLLGLGGGTLIVPWLTLALGVPLIQAVGVSLVCVIVTSGAAAGVYLERHVANLRLGMTLELFTAIGALVGGLVAFLLPERVLELMFGGLLVYVSISMARRREPARPVETPTDGSDDVPVIADATSDSIPAAAVEVAQTDPSFVERLSGPGYRVHRLGFGLVGSLFAGVVSALLGIGGGTVKVPVMHVVMGVPLRVATATSNLMMGITASAGAIIYLIRGGIDPYVAGPTAIGVFLGASIGSRVAHRIHVSVLRGLFVTILLYTAWQMLQRALA